MPTEQTGQQLLEEVRQPLADRQKLDSLAAMAGKVAHDFGNLLTGIMGNASLARMSGTIPGGPLEQIEGLAQRAAVLCRQLASFAGQGTGGGVPVLLREALERAAARAGSEVRVEGPVGPTALTDPSLLGDVIGHLIANASEASKGKGEVVLRVLEKGPDTGILRFGDQASPLAWFEVRDTGPGMEPEVLGRVFEPFFTTRPGNRGMGLPFVLGMVRGHRGAIQLTSNPHEGTTVRVGLPAGVGMAVSPSVALTPEAPTGRKTVLLADDEGPVLDVVSRLLASLGYKVIQARDGEEALAAFARNAPAVRVAMLDLSMPGLPGDEATHRLRALAPGLPIIVMSGHPEADIKPRFAGVPFVEHLQKPFRLPALIELLRKVVG